MALLYKEYFVSVNSLSTSKDEYVVPNGKTWEIQRFTGASAYDVNTHVKLTWDGTTIYSTYGDGNFVGDTAVVGNGTKKLAIELINNTLSAKNMGGIAVVYERDT